MSDGRGGIKVSGAKLASGQPLERLFRSELSLEFFSAVGSSLLRKMRMPRSGKVLCWDTGETIAAILFPRSLPQPPLCFDSFASHVESIADRIPSVSDFVGGA